MKAEMTADGPKINLAATEALVLFEFLSRFDSEGRLEIQDQSEEIVLNRILGTLEALLVPPLQPSYVEQLRAARTSIRASA